MFLLHTLCNVPGTFEEMAENLLARLSELSPRRIDLICDTYINPSIKDTEHQKRGVNESLYSITGPQQRCPKDFLKLFLSPSFKTALFRFLVTEWKSVV